MSVAEALQAARVVGVTVDVDGDDLVLEAPEPPPAPVLELLSREKASIVALLRPQNDSWTGNDWRTYFHERVAIAEQRFGLPPTDAEARAFDFCVVEWSNRQPTRSSPNCCCWCGGMKREDNVLLPFGTESVGHAWLHSACWRSWYEHRKAAAIAALTAMGIAPKAEFPDDFAKNGAP